MKLYEIVDSINSLLEAEDLSPQAIDDTLEGLELSLVDKGRNIAALRQNWLSTERAIGDEIKRLQERKKVFANRRAALEEYLRFNMERSGIEKIESPEFSITLGKPTEVVEIDDAVALPDEFIVIKRTPAKAEIKRALANGKEVRGARLAEGKRRLIIK